MIMSEQVKLTPSWAYYWKSWILVGFLFFLTYKVFLSEPIFSLFVGLPPVCFTLAIFISKYQSKFIINEEKIFYQESKTQINALYLSNIEKIEIHQSLVQKLLNIGSLCFNTSRDYKSKVEFFGIFAPKNWKRKIEDRIKDLRKKTRETETNNSRVHQLQERATKSCTDNSQVKLYKLNNLLHYSKKYSSFTLHCCFIDDEIETSTAFNAAVIYIDKLNKDVFNKYGSTSISRTHYSKGYLTWIAKPKHLIGKLEKVGEGQKLYELWVNICDGLLKKSLRSLHAYKHSNIESPSAGYYEHIRSIRERRGYFMSYIIYDDVNSYRTHRFNNKYQKLTDSFSKEKSFYWSSIGSPSDELLKALRFCDKTHADITSIKLNNYLSFKPINKTGIDHIRFEFNYRNLNLKAGDTISFLLSGGEVIHFVLPDKMEVIDPGKLKVTNVIISREEIQKLARIELDKVRIHQKSINYKLDIPIDKVLDSWIVNKENKQFVIKSLFDSHFTEVKKQVENYRVINAIDDSEPEEREEDYCYVYLMKDTTNNFHKIGISSKPKYRERTLQSEKPTIELTFSKVFPLRTIAENMEKTLHESFSDKRIRGEWFELSDDDVEHIKQSLK